MILRLDEIDEGYKIATSAQFLNRKKPLPKVLIIAGRNQTLVDYCVDVALSRIGNQLVRRYADETTVKHLLTELGAVPVFGDQVYIYYQCQDADDLDILVWYAENPTSGITLILTANALRRDDGTRWMPSNKTVLYVDCGNLSEKSMQKFVISAGVPSEDSEWLLDRCAWDISEVIRLLKLSSLTGGLQPGDIRSICDPIYDSGFDWLAFGIIDVGSVISLIWQLKRRIIQMLRLSIGMLGKSNVMDLAKRAGIEPVVVKRLIPVVKGTQPAIWLSRLEALIQVEQYTNLPGMRKYLEAIVS